LNEYAQEDSLPLYEYECVKCGRRTEKIQKFSDSPLTKCESCGGRLERLISSPAIQFKGSGWYVTDYAKPSSAAASKDSSADQKEVSSGSKESSPAGSDGTGKKPPEASKPAEPAKSPATKASSPR